VMYLYYDYQNFTNQTPVNMASTFLSQATKRLSLSNMMSLDAIGELQKVTESICIENEEKMRMM
jgi:hypothetical protein